MIIVTGGAGMIGANIIHKLNAEGRDDIVVVDDLTDGTKFRNIAKARIGDYMDKDEFLAAIQTGAIAPADVVFHQGACSSTTEWDGRMMMANNFSYSKAVYQWCRSNGSPFIYASSAAVYGNATAFAEDGGNEAPLNVYGYSKKLFDDYVLQTLRPGDPPVVGLRYFNVYGPFEFHKGSMASVAFHLFNQVQRGERLKLFGAHEGVEAGMQSRDFVHAADVASVNLWAWRSGVSGIFNCGTGRAQPFLDVANAVIANCGTGQIAFIDFPDHLKGRYQNYTQADISRLRAAGFDGQFRTVENGVADYIAYLKDQAGQ